MWNNSSIVLNQDAYYYSIMSRLVLWGYIGLIASILGILGNLVTIIILLSPSMRMISTHIYLTALACSDILYLLMFIPSYSLRYIINYPIYLAKGSTSTFDTILAQVPLTFLYNVVLFSNLYITIAVSIDRLMSVKYPLKAKQFLTQRTTILVILSVYIFTILSCIPFWFEREYNSKTKTCQQTPFGTATHRYLRIYYYIPFFCVFPFLVLIYINVNILQSLTHQRQRKQSLGIVSSSRKQIDWNITVMIFIIIIVSVVCYLPLTIRNILNAFNTTVRLNPFFLSTLNAIVVLINVFNTSTNFLLYCFFIQRFRMLLKEMYLRTLSRGNQLERVSTREQQSFGLELLTKPSEEINHTSFQHSNEPDDSLPLCTYTNGTATAITAEDSIG